MKKIIAMVLAVAMIAAFGVSAFAATPATSNKLDIPTVQEWYDALKAPSAKTQVEAYAKLLDGSKQYYKDAQDALKDLLKATQKAIQVAQYAIVADAIYTQRDLLNAAVASEINKAIAQSWIDYENAIANDAPINYQAIWAGLHN